MHGLFTVSFSRHCVSRQSWKPFPEEWNYALESSEEIDAEADPRVGEFNHPEKGLIPTYLFENTRNTRLYFDEELGQWARMPLLWECNAPEVREMLDELNRVYPKWKNVQEQLLSLRECNYDLQDAIIFAEINFDFTQGGKGGATVGDLTRVHDLELKLKEKEKEIQRLRSTRDDEQYEEVAYMKRERTNLDVLAKRRDRDAQAAEVRSPFFFFFFGTGGQECAAAAPPPPPRAPPPPTEKVTELTKNQREPPGGVY